MRWDYRWAVVFGLAAIGCRSTDTPSNAMPNTATPSTTNVDASAGTPDAATPNKPPSTGGISGNNSTAIAGKSGASGSASTSAGASAPIARDAGNVDTDSGAPPTGNPPATGVDVAALKATGIDKYIGAAKPARMEAGANGETAFHFDVADGPKCLRGDPYAMAIRKQDSENLLIYLQGGGSCSSAVCSATPTASPRIPATGLTSREAAQSPVAGWNVVYVPYCDGSLHYGDKDHAQESPPRYHHGLRNLSAALDVGVANFPAPKKILLSGSSAGGLGTIYGAILVRLLYPNAQLFVFNDSGVGVSTPDGMRAKLTRDEWATAQLIPPSCPECVASAHSTPVITWNLQRDPELRVGIFSAYEDTVIADTFLMIGGPAFKQALLDVTGKVVTAYPDRAKRFYIDGTKHTTAGNLQATMVGGVTIKQWLDSMLTGDPKWTDTLQ